MIQRNAGGKDCSLTPQVVTARDSLRVQLCQALVSAAGVQDASTSLLDTLAGSLQVSFVPDEVVNVNSKQVCAQALTVVTNLTSGGYLRRSNLATSKALANILSLFTIKTTSSSSSSVATSPAEAISTSVEGTATTTTYPVDNAVSGLITGVARNMVGGQTPISFATPNYQLAVLSQRE